jgi:hypothetical protein
MLCSGFKFSQSQLTTVAIYYCNTVTSCAETELLSWPPGLPDTDSEEPESLYGELGERSSLLLVIKAIYSMSL